MVQKKKSSNIKEMILKKKQKYGIEIVWTILGSAPRGNPLNLSHRKVMQEQIEAFNQQHGRKLEKTREYIKDTCSLFAVVVSQFLFLSWVAWEWEKVN